jgi:multidrug efflux pump subunit AcrB
VIGAAFGTLALVVVVFGMNLRREFFPEVDAGASEIYARTKCGTRIEVTEGYVEAVETYTMRKLGNDLELVISEIGLTADVTGARPRKRGERPVGPRGPRRAPGRAGDNALRRTVRILAVDPQPLREGA